MSHQPSPHSIRRRSWRARPVAAAALFSAAALATVVQPPAPASASAKTIVFGPTGASQSWTVPPGVTLAKFDVYGAAGGTGGFGGNNPGLGGQVTTQYMTVTPGDVLTMDVGTAGTNGSPGLRGAGGFNGGGEGAPAAVDVGGGGGGGGASAVRIADSTPIAVAGGGGGAGGGNDVTHSGGANGGPGGGGVGIDGAPGPGSAATGGKGAVTSVPGLGGAGDGPGLEGGAAALNVGGKGGSLPDDAGGGGGGGGGGYAGGGGGGGVPAGPTGGGAAGGGGGSAFGPGDSTMHTNVQGGDGLIVVKYSSDSAPVALDKVYNGFINIPLTANKASGLVAGSTPDGLTVQGQPLPLHGTMTTNADGSFEYRPNAGFVGSETFRYTLQDDVGRTTTGQIQINISRPPETAFIKQQYTDFLDTTPTTAELTAAEGRFRAGTVTRSAFVEEMSAKPAFEVRQGQVTRTYRAFFTRNPDDLGYLHFIDAMKKGMTLTTLSDSFATSSEFQTRYGTLTNGAFVDLVYKNVLGRAPDAAGRAAWLDQLNRHVKTRGQVMAAFAQGPEFVGKTDSISKVVRARYALLRHLPAATVINTESGQLTSGTTYSAMIDRYLRLPEYKVRFPG